MNRIASQAHLRCALALAALFLLAPTTTVGADNYLIVTAEEYVGSAPLAQFVAAKTARGFSVTTYTAVPGTSRETIKAYVETLWNSPAPPDYILLIGDAASSGATATTLPYWSGGGSKHSPSDLPYGCMDDGDDWHPEIPVGRFPITSVDMLQAVVDKTLFVEAGNFPDPDYVKRGAFLANPSTYGMAEPAHDWVIDNLFVPNGYEGVRLYSRDGANTQSVTAAVNSGSLWAVYYGHSSSSGWWNPSFNGGNVRSLSNEGLYGVVTSHSCNVGNFTIGECFGETWIREPNKGAAAVILPTDYIYWGSVEAWRPSTILEHSWFRAFFEDNIWEVGPAWHAALYRFEAEFDGSTDIERNFFELYNLLGDPSLLLPRPYGFTLAATPESQSICCPPDEQAVYTIEVGETGGFADPVTLSVAGAPLGATIDFSVNDIPPPFVTDLTVGNIDASMTGDYIVVITGTSDSMLRSTQVGLTIAGGVSDQVTLLSPPDGATGVPLRPELTWQTLPDATEYDVQIATDADFTNVVYETTATDEAHTVEAPLDTLTRYYWHVRGVNACGDGEFSAAYSFFTVNMLLPLAYDLLNGETGTYTYFDDSYNGDGDNSVPLAPLSGGIGDLTDGVIATQNWDGTNLPYIGWKSIEPTLTFHFDGAVNIDTITLHLDDSNGSGGVYPPTDVRFEMGDTILDFEVQDPSGGEPFAATFEDLALSGDLLEITLLDDYFSSSRYMMISEIEITGGSVPGDLDGDGDVDQGDLGILLADWGCTGVNCAGDCDGDGDTDQADLGILLANWGYGT